MTTAILEKPTVWEVASQLDSIRDHLRITHEMMIEQLSDTLMTSVEGVSITHERLFLLLDSVTGKLKEMERLDNVLLTMGRESKGPSHL